MLICYLAANVLTEQIVPVYHLNYNNMEKYVIEVTSSISKCFQCSDLHNFGFIQKKLVSK